MPRFFLGQLGLLLLVTALCAVSLAATAPKCTGALARTTRAFEENLFTPKTYPGGDIEPTTFYRYIRPKKGKQTYVLIHGMSHDSQDWDQVAAGLASRGFGVLVVDLIGHGRSLVNTNPKFQLQETTVVTTQSLAIEYLIKDLDIPGQLYIVGHSFGGLIAYRMAKDLSREWESNGRGWVTNDRVAHLALLSPYNQRLDVAHIQKNFGGTNNIYTLGGSMSLFAHAASGFFGSSLVRQSAPDVIRDYYSQLPWQMPPEFIAKAADNVAFQTNSIVQYNDKDIETDRWRLDRTIPVTVAYGTADQLNPYTEFRNMNEKPIANRDHFELHPIEGADHDLAVENPDQVLQLIIP